MYDICDEQLLDIGREQLTTATQLQKRWDCMWEDGSWEEPVDTKNVQWHV